MRLEYVVEDVNDLFRALRHMVDDNEIEVDNFLSDPQGAQDYLYRYQNNVNKSMNGVFDIIDLDSRIEYASVQKSVIGFEYD